MCFTRSQRVASENARIWEYINYVLTSDERLRDLEIDRNEIEQVVVFFRAGNRLHPTKGYDFLGQGWKGLPDDVVRRQLDQRDRVVEAIVNRFLRILVDQGYSVARDFTESASEYQVLFVGSSQDETAKCLSQMFERGLGENELSDNFLEQIGRYLVFGYDENLSYYMSGDDIRP